MWNVFPDFVLIWFQRSRAKVSRGWTHYSLFCIPGKLIPHWHPEKRYFEVHVLNVVMNGSCTHKGRQRILYSSVFLSFVRMCTCVPMSSSFRVNVVVLIGIDLTVCTSFVHVLCAGGVLLELGGSHCQGVWL